MREGCSSSLSPLPYFSTSNSVVVQSDLDKMLKKFNPTNNSLLINFLLSYNAEILLIITD